MSNIVQAIKVLFDAGINPGSEAIGYLFTHINDLENNNPNRSPFLDELEKQILDYMNDRDLQNMGKVPFVDFYNWLKDNEEI